MWQVKGINLLGISGIEAAQQLKTEPVARDIPVITVFSNAMQKDTEHALVQDFNGYLTKPIDLPRHELLEGYIFNQFE